MNFFQKNRDKLFPLLKGEWHKKTFINETIPALKKSKPSELSYTTWFFFHPSAYWLMYWGAPLITIITLLPISLYFLLNGRVLSGSITSIVTILTGKSFYEKIKNKKLYPKDYTFYDNWLKTPEDDFGIKIEE